MSFVGSAQVKRARQVIGGPRPYAFRRSLSRKGGHGNHMQLRAAMLLQGEHGGGVPHICHWGGRRHWKCEAVHLCGGGVGLPEGRKLGLV